MYNRHHNKHAVMLMVVVATLCFFAYSCAASEVCITTITENGPVEVCVMELE